MTVGHISKKKCCNADRDHCVDSACFHRESGANFDGKVKKERKKDRQTDRQTDRSIRGNNKAFALTHIYCTRRRKTACSNMN